MGLMVDIFNVDIGLGGNVQSFNYKILAS